MSAFNRFSRPASRIVSAIASTLVAMLLAELVLNLVGAPALNPPIYPGERVAAQAPSVDPAIGWKLPPKRSIVETTDPWP